MNYQIKAPTRAASWQAAPPALANVRVGIIGLGYVGLPLAVYMARAFPGHGLRRQQSPRQRAGKRPRPHRRSDRRGICRLAGPLPSAPIPRSSRDCNFYIVTVPTPIDARKATGPHRADALQARRSAACSARRHVVVYESTVYPGRHGGGLRADPGEGARALSFNDDFFVGYSPERINPGDMQHRLPTSSR